MDVLEADGLVRPGTRVDLLGNSLVLVAHGRTAPPVTISPDLDLAGLLGEAEPVEYRFWPTPPKPNRII